MNFIILKMLQRGMDICQLTDYGKALAPFGLHKKYIKG